MCTQRSRLLVVDDDNTFREVLCRALSSSFHVAEATNCRAATHHLERQRADALLVDMRLGSETGLSLLPWLRTHSLELVQCTVFMSGSIAALRQVPPGHLCLRKPFDADDAVSVLARVLARG